MEAHFQILKDNKLKITPRRKAAISLFKDSGVCMGPYDVHKKLRNRLPTLGLPTVYRILEELSRAGILIRSLSEDRQLRYMLCVHPHEHHHHFTCRKCKKVEEVDFCNFKAVSQFIENKLNAKAETHQLQIEGLCSKCK